MPSSPRVDSRPAPFRGAVRDVTEVTEVTLPRAPRQSTDRCGLPYRTVRYGGRPEEHACPSVSACRREPASTSHREAAPRSRPPASGAARRTSATGRPATSLPGGAARRLVKRLFGHDLFPSDDRARMLCDDLYGGDPVAERYVDEVFFGETGHQTGPRAARCTPSSTASTPCRTRRSRCGRCSRSSTPSRTGSTATRSSWARRSGAAGARCCSASPARSPWRSTPRAASPLPCPWRAATPATTRCAGSWSPRSSGSTPPPPATCSGRGRPGGRPRCRCGSCTSRCASGSATTPSGTTRSGGCRSARPT